MDWPLAIIKEVFPGKDGYNRVVNLKTGRGELIRPIQRLIPLEMRQDVGEFNKFFESNKNRPKYLRSRYLFPKSFWNLFPKKRWLT